MLTPGVAAPLLNEAMCLQLLGRIKEAIPLLRKAADLDSDADGVTVRLGQALIDNNEYQEAEIVVRTALSRMPENGHLLELLGGILKQIGRFDEAVQAIGRAIELQPERVSLALDYVSCKKMSEADRPHLRPAFDQADRTTLKLEERTSLHFAIAKFNDDIEDYATAIHHFDIAHQLAEEVLKSKNRTFNEAQMTARFNSILTTFTRERLNAPSVGQSSSARPLFILGMVRSGTTLVEQIVSRHSKIASGGELPFWPQNWQRVKPHGSRFSEREVSSIGSEYLSLLESIDSTTEIVTDKMPGNYIALGSILATFPCAKIIYCKRRAIDNCVSIYTTPFRSSHEWLHRRENIVAFYRLHDLLMEHWRAVLRPGTMLEVSYEELVMDPEGIARKIIEFIGLDWEDACLTPEANERPVRTPSQWQVRQPVYQSSVDRWRNYEPWLGAFKNLLPEEAN